MIDLKITKKLLDYFFIIQNSDFTVTFANICDPKKIYKFKKNELPKSIFKNTNRLFLIDSEGQFLTHKEEKEICQAIKLESYVLREIGLTDYNTFHQNTSVRSFNDYLKSKNPEEMIKLENQPEELTNKILRVITEFLKNNRIKDKNEIRFQYISRDLQGISPINKLIQKYSVKKENYTYTVTFSKNLLADKIKIVSEIKDTLEEFIKTSKIESEYHILNN